MNYSDLSLQVVISSLATVGLVEFLKNFIKTEKTWVYSVLMLPLAIFCYFASVKMPIWVIGGILTIGTTQLCYQTIIQTFKAIIKGVSYKIGATEIKENEDE